MPLRQVSRVLEELDWELVFLHKETRFDLIVQGVQLVIEAASSLSEEGGRFFFLNGYLQVGLLL